MIFSLRPEGAAYGTESIGILLRIETKKSIQIMIGFHYYETFSINFTKLRL